MTATYSCPLAEKLIGAELGTSFRRVFQIGAPVAASYATNILSRDPTNTTPPPVARAPVVSGARWRWTHAVFLVARLSACRRPYLPSLSGRGQPVQRTPVESLPRSPSATGTRSMHASTMGTYTIFVAASYEVGIQPRPPLTCGHTILVLPSPGRRLGSLVFAPVFGSIDVTSFCSPRSVEERYLPVSVSTMSKIICLPAVTTTLRVSPFTGNCTTIRSNAQSRS